MEGVQAISMDRAEAQTRLRHTRRALHRRADVEYEQLAEGLEQLASGRRLLVMSETLRHVPRDEQGRPRVALARADRRQVRYDRANLFTERFGVDFRPRGGPALRYGVLEFPLPDTPAARMPTKPWPAGYALVPIVPPDIRINRDLSRYFVLWEVEQWSEREIGAPAADPYLLERINDELYAIVAEWDVTPLERAIAMGTRGQRR